MEVMQAPKTAVFKQYPTNTGILGEEKHIHRIDLVLLKPNMWPAMRKGVLKLIQ